MPDIASLTIQNKTYAFKDSTARTVASSAQQAATEASSKVDSLELTGSLTGETLTLGIEVAK